MGNAQNLSSRERPKSESTDLSLPNSPANVTITGKAFDFDKKNVDLRSEDDDEPYYTKPVGSSINNNNTQNIEKVPRQRSNTISEGTSNLNRRPSSSMSTSADDNAVVDNDALPTVFKWDGGGKQVYISGTFSNWKALPMVKSHKDFVTIVDLPEGDHQYKFFVDGEWRHDPKMKNVENDIGTKNNMISVRQSDFEVFQALAKDSEDAASNGQKEYSQDIPQSKPWEKVSGPPVLPPHLLQVILNKDTPLSCEPTLLPEPNHVMLNHLYALSIKEGVMVLSATHRYRKKYVTTLLYKPI
ncbi:PRKAB2 family protein [Megaselia abdita]